jgi:hypothetical protein
MDPVVAIVLKGLEIVAAAAPGFLAMFTGKASDEEALEHAHDVLSQIPTRTGPDGTWTKDLERRKRGGS